MRRVLAVITMVGVLLLVALAGWGKETLVLGTWGGGYEALFKAEIIPLFEEKYDCEILVDVGSSTARIAKIAAQVNDQQIDVAMETAEALLAGIAQGVLEPLDPAVITNLAGLQENFTAPFAKDGVLYGTAVSWSATGILWRPDLVPFEITSWKDLWHRSLEGKIALQTWPNAGAIDDLVMASYAHGGDLYNMEPGFNAYKDLMPNVHHFFEISSQAPAEVMSGEVWVTVTIAGRGVPYIPEGMRVTIPEEGTTYGMQCIAIAKNTKHYDLASKFVNFMLSPEVQAIWSCDLLLPPVNPAAELSEECQAQMAETPEVRDSLWYIDFEYLSQKKEEWVEWFNREVNQ